MGQNMKKLFLLSPDDIRRMRKLIHHLDRALCELIELKRVTTFDDQRQHYTPGECDLIEDASFIENQLEFHFKNNPDF